MVDRLVAGETENTLPREPTMTECMQAIARLRELATETLWKGARSGRVPLELVPFVDEVRDSFKNDKVFKIKVPATEAEETRKAMERAARRLSPLDNKRKVHVSVTIEPVSDTHVWLNMRAHPAQWKGALAQRMSYKAYLSWAERERKSLSLLTPPYPASPLLHQGPCSLRRGPGLSLVA